MRIPMDPPIPLPDWPEFDGPSSIIAIDDTTGVSVVLCEGGRIATLGGWKAKPKKKVRK